MQYRGIVQNFTAEAAILKYRIAAFGTADGQIVPANGVNATMFGVTSDVDATQGERADVIMSGVAPVTYGGTVTRGALLTSDSTGRAVAAAPAQGANARIIGIARVSGVVGDIGFVQISPGIMQGA